MSNNPISNENERRATVRVGSFNLVNSRKLALFGAFPVTGARLQIMLKFIWVIIFDALASPILYLVSVGIGIGALVDKNLEGPGVGGVSYLTFIAPALLAATAIQGAMDEVVFPSLDGFKWQKNYFAMNATPITPTQIATGVFIAALIRTVFTVICYWSLLYLFGAFDSPRAWLAIPTAIFAGASFAALMLGAVSYMENEDLFLTIINRLVIMPLFLFSGTFYPLENMPIFLQPIGWISPIWHATELGRYLTYQYPLSLLEIAFHFLLLAALLVIGLLWAFKNFANRLEK
jgi:lipooligosaccharide transport system permease protein